MSEETPKPDPVEKKPGKRARKKAARAAVLEDLRTAGVVDGAKAVEIAEKIGVEPPPVPSYTASPAVHPLVLARNGGVPVNLPLTDDEKSRILEYLESGFNRSAAILEARVSYGRFRNQLVNDPGFADDVKVIENSRIGRCTALLYGHALDGDGSAIVTYIRNEQNRVNSAHGRAMAKRELALREKIINAQLNISQSDKSDDIDLSAIPKEDWDNYMRLCDAIRDGVELSAEDYAAYGKYQAIIIRAQNAPKPPPPGLVSGVLSLPLTGMEDLKGS